MALTMSYTADDGSVYPNCYIPIGAIVLAPMGATICTNFFATEQAYLDNELPLVQPAFSTGLSLFDTGPAFDVAYDYLLTLPEFAGAVIVNTLSN
jgi:hypothetical protein